MAATGGPSRRDDPPSASSRLASLPEVPCNADGIAPSSALSFFSPYEPDDRRAVFERLSVHADAHQDLVSLVATIVAWAKNSPKWLTEHTSLRAVA